YGTFVWAFCRYVLTEVSGANLNSAVSLGLLIGRRIRIKRFVLYLIAQELDAFGGEVLCTFLSVTTVFAATDGVMGNKHGHIRTLLPFAIGMAVLLSHLVLIPVDGCSINPARSFGTSVTNNNWESHW
ncbi:unnamed protein product, partial [Sphacelaria rigidula]